MNLARALVEGFRARMNNDRHLMLTVQHIEPFMRGWNHAERLINTEVKNG